MATIKDVAKLAGVSIGTVSRVLSRNPTVQASVAARVQAAIKDLQYRPNLSARALRTNKIDIIGLIVPDITNPFFAQLAKDVEMAAARKNISVMLANSFENVEMEERRISAILERAPCGIIFVPSSDAANIDIPDGLAFVALDRPYKSVPFVATDHRLSAALAADHLYDLHHRRIAYVAGPRDTIVAREREIGFVTRLNARSVAGDPVTLTVHEGAFDYASGEAIGRKLFSLPPAERPSAIAAASDQQAIGVIRAARDMGIRVPEDVSVVGYDDITLASLIVPRLTTVRQPVTDLAHYAMQLILAPDETPSPKLFLGELVHRTSTAICNDKLDGK